MAVKFLFFAQCAQWMECKEREVHIDAPATVLEIIRSIEDFLPLERHKETIKVSINQEFARFDSEVRDGDEVAFLPPFSGG